MNLPFAATTVPVMQPGARPGEEAEHLGLDHPAEWLSMGGVMSA
ncbi:hypothetical protein [Nonomuraea sp. NPDC049784]